VASRHVQNVGVEVETSLFGDWIYADPPSRAGIVIPIPVIEQVGFIILILAGEAEGVGLSHGARCAEDFTEGAVFILGKYKLRLTFLTLFLLFAEL
jgi:hypothetical protein